MHKRLRSSGGTAAVAAAASRSDCEDDELDGESSSEEEEASSDAGSCDSSDSADSNESFGRKCARERVHAKTRVAYKRYMVKFKAWAIGNGFENEVDATTKSLKLPFNLDMLKQYFGFLSNRQIPWPNHEESGKTKNMAPGTLKRICTAISDKYRQSSMQMGLDVQGFFHNFHRFYLLKIGEKMSADPPEYPVDAISMPLSAESWRHLMMAVWTAVPGKDCSWKTLSQLRTFLNLAKPLLCRQQRVVRIRWSVMQTKMDALGCKVPTSKSDVIGKLSYLKLLFPSPQDPRICIFLSLALEICSKSTLDPEESFERVFSTSFSNGLSANFRTFIDSLDESVRQRLEVGTGRLPITLHTPKRTGSVELHDCEAILWDSCKQRADHTIDEEGSYIKYPSPNQDGIMGRVLAGLKFGTDAFELQGPHFDPNFAATLQYDRLVPAFSKFPDNVKTLLPLMIANIVYHHDWLQRTLPSHHPIWASVPLFNSESSTLERLKQKNDDGTFKFIYGGVSGVGSSVTKSFLPLSGQSLMSQDHAALRAMREDFAQFKLAFQSRAPAAVISIGAKGHEAESAGELRNGNTILRKICELHDVITGNVMPGTAVARGPLPIADLPASFLITTGLRPDQLIRKWFCPLGRLPAWRHITPTQLPRPPAPKNSKVQQDLLRKYTKVMQCLMGRTSETLIAANVEFATVVLWENLARLGGFPVSARWSCSYLYDKLTPDICARAISCVISGPDFLRATPVCLARIRAADVAVAAASSDLPLLAVAVSQAGVLEVEELQALNVAVGAQRIRDESNHQILPIPYGFRVLSLPLEELWTVWHSHSNHQGWKQRWRGVVTSANLKISLTAEGVDETIHTQQRQLLSKVTCVLKKLQGQMTDAEVDTNVKAMYAICHQNVMQCIAERGLQGMETCLEGTITTVYLKLLKYKPL